MIIGKKLSANKNRGTYEFIGKPKQNVFKYAGKKWIQSCDLVYLQNQLIVY